MIERKNMSEAHFIALVFLGVTGDLLLRATPWGINFSLWIVATVSIFVAMRRWKNVPPLSRDMRLMLAATICFAVLVSWREAVGLKLLNFFVVFVSISLGGAIVAGRNIRQSRLTEYAVAGLGSFVSVLTYLGVAFPGMAKWMSERERGNFEPLMAIVRGVILALPLLFFFGWLFASADAIFERLVVNIFNFDSYTPATHLILTLAFAWVAGAIFSLLSRGPHESVDSSESVAPAQKGAIEINVALALLEVLFLSFVIVQIQYFFGGHERIIEEAGLTYADYARRGFFELATVAAFVLVLLLACSRQLERAPTTEKQVFNILAILLIAQVLVIIASALHRMDLYVDAYGLTRLRVYVAAFICWMFVVFIWLSITLASNRTRAFAFGFLMSGFVATFLLQTVNPDAVVMRVNLERMQEGDPFDAEYAWTLSDDAIPEIVKVFPDLTTEQKYAVRPQLERARKAAETRPLRSWTWGHFRTVRALEEIQP